MVAKMGERAFRGVKAKRVPVRRGLELLLLKAAQRATAKAAPIDACGVWTWTALDGDSDNGPTHELLRDSAGAQGGCTAAHLKMVERLSRTTTRSPVSSSASTMCLPK